MSVYIALNACYFLSATYFFDEFFCLLRLCISYLSATVFYHDVARVNNVPRTARAAIISLTAIVVLLPSLPRTITRLPSAVNVYVVCTKRSTPAAPSNRHTKPNAGVMPLRTRKHQRATTANNTIVAMPCRLTL